MAEPTKIIADIGALGDLTQRLQDLVTVGRRRVALHFRADVRLDQRHISTLADVIDRCPGLVELVLVQASPSIGFVASALSLRLPRLQIRTERGETRAPRELTGTHPTSSRQSQRISSRSPRSSRSSKPTRPSGPTGALTVIRIPVTDDPLHALHNTLTDIRQRKLVRVALILPPDFRAHFEFTQTLTKALLQTPTLRELNFVSTAPSAGFMASSISLVMPKIRVRAVRALNDIPS